MWILIVTATVTTIFLILILTVYYIVDSAITNKRLKQNQIAWDEFSKNMSCKDKKQCYLEWCHKRKIEKGWHNYYFPKM